MRTIDIHAHMAPEALWTAVDSGSDWFGVRSERDGQGLEWLVLGGERTGPNTPKLRFNPQQRMEDMDSMGIDVQVISLAPTLYNYHLDPVQGLRAAEEVNNETSALVKEWPNRFQGLATLPMQDVSSAVKELERAVVELGLKGAELDTAVNGKTWDDIDMFPLFKAAEEMGALLFFHPSISLVWSRTSRYHLGNTIGFTLEDTLVAAALIFGGVLDRFPKLKVCIAHGGGTTCFGAGRMDRGWQVRPEARARVPKPPSAYLRHMYYDCITHSEAALRFLLDTVGADRVVLGTDWPYDMGYDAPVEWIKSLESLTCEEKDRILWKNLDGLLDPAGTTKAYE